VQAVAAAPGRADAFANFHTRRFVAQHGSECRFVSTLVKALLCGAAEIATRPGCVRLRLGVTP